MCAWKSELYCTAFNKQQLPPSNRPEIVFVGRSNVGKSTLINALLARKIAKVSSSPGKTRSINFYNVEAEGRLFSLVDIPGYGYAARGYAERQAWWKLIDDYFGSGRNISFVVHLIDFRHGFLPNDCDLTKWLDAKGLLRLVVFTKGDKISPGRRNGLYQQYMRSGIISVLPPFVTSGVDDQEMEALRRGITEILDELGRMGDI